MNNISCLNYPRPFRVEKCVAKLYVFFLTLRMISPLLFTQQLFHTGAKNFDFVLHVIGVMLILLRNKGKVYLGRDQESRLFKSFALLVLYLNVSSFFMATVMQYTYGSIGSDTAFDAFISMAVYYSQYVFMFFYNKEVFCILSKKELEDVLKYEMWFLLVLGYIQIIAYNFGGIVGLLYDRLDLFDVFADAKSLGKLTLTRAEGAASGGVIGILVLPYLLSGIINNEKHFSEIVQILLWLPVIFFTKSSTAYLLITLVLVGFVLICIQKTKVAIPRKTVYTLLVVCLTLCVCLLFGEVFTGLVPDFIGDEIQYLLTEKMTDMSNGSTVSRTVPFVTNFGAFKEYPILGVGNGCQGYFYIKYFPSWAKNVSSSDVMVFYRGAQERIVNGALFFPSILSGYGIVGTLLIAVYVIKSHKVFKSKADSLGRFKYFYLLSLLPIILYGFQGEFAGEYFIFFLLSIPYMRVCETTKDK